MPNKSPTVKSSGTSELPTLLPYPTLIPFAEFNGVNGMFCYIFEHYGLDGISCLVQTDNEGTRVIVGDWHGHVTDLSDSKHRLYQITNNLLMKHGTALINLIRAVRLKQAQFFFVPCGDGSFMLADVQLALNKFAGPGMIKDVFGKMFNIPKLIKIDVVKDKILQDIIDGSGQFAGNLIIKPSRFRMVKANNIMTPLYLEVSR